MLTQIDFFLIALDYLCYLLRPVVSLVQINANLCKQALVQRASNNRPAQWALAGAANLLEWSRPAANCRGGSSQVAREISAHYEARAHRLAHKLQVYDYFNTLVPYDGRQTAETHAEEAASVVLMRRLRAAIMEEWPEAAVRLASLDDNFVRLLDWSTCDLLVVSGNSRKADTIEFDWRQLLVKVAGAHKPTPLGQEDSADVGDRAAAGERPLRKRKCGFNEAANDSGSADAPSGRTQIDRSATQPSSRSSDSGKDEWPATRLVYSRPEMKTALVRTRTRGGKCETFCLLRHMTLDEYSAHDKRSRLVFQLCQRHQCSFAELYSLLSDLLERAGLLEPSGFCLRSEALLVESSRQGTPPASNRPDGGAGSKPAIERWLGSVDTYFERRSTSGENPSDENKKAHADHQLGRFALALMVGAFLDAAARRREHTRDGEMAALLNGFLETYSQTSDEAKGGASSGALPAIIIVRAAPSRVPLELEIISELGGADRLGAADSISLVGDLCSARLFVLDPTSGSDCNLTSNLSVWPEIGRLFANLRSRIDSSCHQVNLLDSLFEMADLQRKRPLDAPTRRESSEGIGDSKRGPDDWTTNGKERSEAAAAGETESSPLPQGQAPRPTSGFCHTYLRFLGSCSLLQSRHIWRNIFYFMLFILIRNLLVSYLEGIQKDLKQQSREEFIELKRMLYPEHTQDDNDDDPEDGIRILIRDEDSASKQEASSDGRGVGVSDVRVNGQASTQVDDEERDGSEGDFDAALGSLMNTIMRQAFKAGAPGGNGRGALPLEDLQRILEALGGGDELDLGELGELMGQLRHLLPGILAVAGGGGQENLFESLGLGPTGGKERNTPRPREQESAGFISRQRSDGGDRAAGANISPTTLSPDSSQVGEIYRGEGEGVTADGQTGAMGGADGQQSAATRAEL